MNSPGSRWANRSTMTLDYLPGETFPGKIDYIYPYLKEATRTAKVRLRFPNPGLKLKPEMFAQVKIESPVAHNAVVVPADAVIDTGLKQHVFIALGQGRFEPREVKLGVLGNDGSAGGALRPQGRRRRGGFGPIHAGFRVPFPGGGADDDAGPGVRGQEGSETPGRSRRRRTMPPGMKMEGQTASSLGRHAPRALSIKGRL